MSKHRLTRGLSIAMVVLGVLTLIRTVIAAPQGLALGYVFGVGLIVAGGARLLLARKLGSDGS